MPDGQNIKVSFGAIEEAGANINATAAKMDNELDTLRSQLAPLGASYEGASKEAWEAVQNSWNQAQMELNQVLASIGAATKQASEDYVNTEGAVGKLWG
jgi:WXG100 family type VII secretion target